MTWIPITERLPGECVNVLASDGVHVFAACYTIQSWIGGDDQNCIGVTHWMPLPEPPK